MQTFCLFDQLLAEIKTDLKTSSSPKLNWDLHLKIDQKSWSYGSFNKFILFI